MRTLLTAILTVFAFSAHANDGSVGLDAGGLVFLEDRDIAILKEELTLDLTEDHVSVHYVFRNQTATSKTVQIGFPMPPIGADLDGFALNFADDRANFLNFETLADGDPVEAKLVAEIVLGGQVLSRVATDDLVQSLGAGMRITDWPAKYLSSDLRTGGADEESAALRLTYVWTYEFPPEQDVIVFHSYDAAPFHTLNPPWIDPLYDRYIPTDEKAQYIQKYCLTEDGENAEFVEAVLLADEKEWQAFTGQLGYVLSTGANWAGSIRDFNLQVKWDQDWVKTSHSHHRRHVAICRDRLNLKNTSQGLSGRLSNFEPDFDIALEYVDIHRPRDECKLSEAEQIYDFVIPCSFRELITEKDLTGLSAKQLRRASDEILARRGYDLRGSDTYESVFKHMRWYIPKQSPEALSEIEEANIITLRNAALDIQ